MSLVERILGFQGTVESHQIRGRLDVGSETWQFVSSWAEVELAKAREKNDSMKLTEEQTFALRGAIKNLKDLLALADPPRERRAPPEE